MSKTGTYMFDPSVGKVVKVSDEIPVIQTEIWFPKGGYKYFDKALQQTFHSKQEKRDFLKSKGLKQLPQEQTTKNMRDKNCQIVNEARVKGGLKPKTESQLIGNTI